MSVQVVAMIVTLIHTNTLLCSHFRAQDAHLSTMWRTYVKDKKLQMAMVKRKMAALKWVGPIFYDDVAALAYQTQRSIAVNSTTVNPRWRYLKNGEFCGDYCKDYR